MDFSELESNIVKWANDKNLIKKDNGLRQFIKTVEEIGEVARALLKNDKHELIDGIGDVLVTLIILAKQHDLDITSCLDTAYKEIKDRTGKTVDGTFIKD